MMEPLGLGLRVTTSMVMLSLFMVAHLLAMPYEAFILDKFEAASALVTLTTLAAGSTLVDDTVATTSKIVVSVLVVVINAVLLAAMVWTLILEALRDPAIQESLKMVGITVPKSLRGGEGSVDLMTDDAVPDGSNAASTLQPKSTTGHGPSVAAAAEQDFLDDALPFASNPIDQQKRNPTAANALRPAGRQAFS